MTTARPVSGAVCAPVPAADPVLVARFAADMARIWPEAWAPGGLAGGGVRLGLAVSGGPDSLALLLLAHAAWPGGVAAATVDHGLREGSAAEAAQVALVCARLGVPHQVLRVTLADGNVQAEAREARYAALAGWLGDLAPPECPVALATAHHADDQAETLLMRLNRASGVAGLAGVRPKARVPGTALTLLRPVLGWRRAELARVVAGAGLVAADDPSNRNAAFDRVRMRANLAACDWIDVPAVAASAGHLADADAALEWAAAREWAEAVVSGGLGLTYRPQAPRAVAMRVVARIVAKLDGADPRGGAVARLFDDLLAGRTVSIGNLVARPGPGGWNFAKAPRRRG